MEGQEGDKSFLNDYVKKYTHTPNPENHRSMTDAPEASKTENTENQK